MEDTLNGKIAFFGGTYDPIHIGHMNLAIHMLEIYRFDYIFFCPAFCSPHKVHSPPKASISDRMKMLELAIEDQPKFKVLDFESKKTSPSYTIDTVEYLKKIYPNQNLYLILSDDSMKDFPKWKEAKKIVEMVNILIGSKENKPLKIPPPFDKALKRGFTKIPIFEINSSEIRQRLKKRLYCSHLLFSKVLKYIDKHQLYRS